MRLVVTWMILSVWLDLSYYYLLTANLTNFGASYVWALIESPKFLFNLIMFELFIDECCFGFSCSCNLHARYCYYEETLKETMCQCEHNTQGKNCEQCKPLYNNREWQAGSYTPVSPLPMGTPNECQSEYCPVYCAHLSRVYQFPGCHTILNFKMMSLCLSGNSTAVYGL